MTLKAPGCPIRKSADQRLLSSPRSLSQSATSFIASQCQGIHQMPLSYLNLEIFLPSVRREQTVGAVWSCDGCSANPIGYFTSCPIERSPCGQPFDWALGTPDKRPQVLADRRKPKTYSQCQIASLLSGSIAATQTRKLDFQRKTDRASGAPETPGFPAIAWAMVEPDGIEPTTSCLQSRRSPN
jgi:hypothetical protein